MSKVHFAMMLSLDGYIAGREGGPSLPVPNEELHRHFNELQRRTSVSLYGRRMYEVMRYWEGVDAGRSAVELEFAEAWQRTPKVVFSTTLESVGPGARLVKEDVAGTVRALKREPGGEIFVGGAGLAASLSRLGLIDEYCLYFLPVVLGGGTPFFEAGSDLRLEPLGTERLAQDVTLVRFRPRSA